MRISQLTVRVVVLALAATVVVRGTPVGQLLFSGFSQRDSATQLLFDPNSPFQSATLSAVDAPLTPIEGAQPEGIAQLASNVASNDPSTNRLHLEKFQHTIKRGSTLASLWRDIKGAPKAVGSFIAAFSLKHPKLKAGEIVSVTRKGAEVVELRRELGDGATLVVTGGADEGYSPRIEQAVVHSHERKVSGTIFSTLVDAARGIDLPYSVVDDFVDLFSNRVDFRKDLQSGDTFTVWFDERRLDDGRLLSTGNIKAASIALQGTMYAVVRYVAKDGAVRYFDEKGEMPTKSFLRYPVQFTRISSVFTHARFHPVLKISRPHNGVDFAAPIGTPVRTVGDGVVTFAGWNNGGGNMIRIAHDSRYTTEYMHLSKIAQGVKTGVRVARGSVIGALGNTGLSSGPHLHFGLFDRGSYVDPMKAKIIQSAPEIKAPQGVFTVIAEMRMAHKSIAVAAAGSIKKKA